MISFSILNLVSALSIGVIIFLMALVHNVKLKATLYTLPIPISIALIATHGKVNSDNVIGLFLVCGFVWLVYFLYERFRLYIVASDVVAAIAYIATGYVAIRLLKINFWTAVLAYCFIWLVLIAFLNSRPHTTKPSARSDTSPIVKGIGVSIISFLLFTAKSYLSGIVVTFPYSGVFAVIETRRHLDTLSRVLTRNSIAILGLFTSIYLLPDATTIVMKLLTGWIVFLVIFKLVQKIEI